MPALSSGHLAAARAIAVGRVALGAGFTLAPGRGLRAWPGNGADASPLARLLARSTGGRDLALGLGTLLAIRHGAPVRGWLEAGMLADAADAGAILLALPSLPRGRAVLALGSAVGAALAGRRLVAALR